MKILGIILVSLLFFLPTFSVAFAQSASLTATVRPNPLKAEIFAPSNVTVGQWFDIRADISNRGTETISKTVAIINTHPELALRGKKKKIGNLFGKTAETVIWQAKANQAGNFVIQVEVEGFLEGEKISASDSTVITASNSLFLSFWRQLIFGS